MSGDMTQEVMAIFREEALDLVQRTLAAMNRAANATDGERKKHIQEICRLLHTLKGAAAAVDHEDVKMRAHHLEDRVAELSNGSGNGSFEALFGELEAIEASFGAKPAPAPVAARPSVPERAKPQLAAQPPAPLASQPARAEEVRNEPVQAVAEWLRVAPERVDQLHAQLGELVLTRLQQDQLVSRMVGLRGTAARAMSHERELSRVLSEIKSELPSETFLKLRKCTESTTHGWRALLDSLQTVCRDAKVLQAQSTIVSQGVEESIQSLRLMPLAPFFEGYAKSARDAARRTGKLVRFQVKASGAEVDRAVLTRLSDALLHLVRNAVVHGLEAPDARKLRGKGAEGSLTLDARAEGTFAVIRVADDGAGVDEERVRQKARALGLEEREDVLDILTQPGFSTRETADDLSGRGVGLDVVHGIVRGLGGTLELTTKRGSGSTFTVRVPITASTTMGLIMGVREHRFGLMLSDVERVIRPSTRAVEQVEGRAAVRIGDERVALVSLADVLGVEGGEPAGEHLPVVVVRQGRHRLALSVDEIPGEHALVVRPFGRAFRGAELFVGGAVQPDHSVVPVLSCAALFARAGRSTHRALTRQLAAERPRAHALRALVVDDSITMRTLIRNVLSAAGYEVTVAEDGLAALTTLDAMPDCQLVVTDLQMPNMDGIELCKALRARAGSYLPIVMVTSVDEDDEKSRALAAGADAYVVKSNFEQVAFLRRVDTLVRGPA